MAMAVYLWALAYEIGVLSTDDKRSGSVRSGSVGLCFGTLPCPQRPSPAANASPIDASAPGVAQPKRTDAIRPDERSREVHLQDDQ